MTKLSTARIDALKKALYIWGQDNKISIYGRNDGTWAVNWAAMGSRTPDEAREYATTIAQARRIADALTRLQIEEDPTIKDLNAETYPAAVDSYLAQFEAAR